MDDDSPQLPELILIVVTRGKFSNGGDVSLENEPTGLFDASTFDLRRLLCASSACDAVVASYKRLASICKPQSWVSSVTLGGCYSRSPRTRRSRWTILRHGHSKPCRVLLNIVPTILSSSAKQQRLGVHPETTPALLVFKTDGRVSRPGGYCVCSGAFPNKQYNNDGHPHPRHPSCCFAWRFRIVGSRAMNTSWQYRESVSPCHSVQLHQTAGLTGRTCVKHSLHYSCEIAIVLASAFSK